MLGVGLVSIWAVEYEYMQLRIPLGSPAPPSSGLRRCLPPPVPCCLDRHLLGYPYKPRGASNPNRGGVEFTGVGAVAGEDERALF